MSDQGIWFKLWDGWENDADLANLSKEDLLHWVLLGGYLKKHGNNGMTCLSKPAIALQKKLMLPNYEAVMNVLKKFPNCVIGEKQKDGVTNTVTCDGAIPETLTITWKNWRNYQGDSSRERMRRLRKNGSSQDGRNVTIKKRGEEKRGEENNNTPVVPKGTGSKIGEWFEKTWKAYPKERRVGKKAALRSYQKAVKTLEEARRVAKALENYLQSKTVKDGFIKNASTFFLNWEDYADERRDIEGFHGEADNSRATGASAGSGEPDRVAQVVAKLGNRMVPETKDGVQPDRAGD